MEKCEAAFNGNGSSDTEGRRPGRQVSSQRQQIKFGAASTVQQQKWRADRISPWGKEMKDLAHAASMAKRSIQFQVRIR